MALSLLCACNPSEEEKISNSKPLFDSEKWQIKDGSVYPYREELVNSVLYTDTIRSLDKKTALELMGEPDRVNENYVYYIIDESKLGLWTLHSSSVVIKFNEQDSVEWIKLHE